MSYTTMLEPGHFEVSVDFSLKEPNANIKVKQFDTFRVKAYLLNRGNSINQNDYGGFLNYEYNFDDYNYDYYIILRIKRPDKKVIFYPCYEYGNSLKFLVGEEATQISGYAQADIAIYYYRGEYGEVEMFQNVRESPDNRLAAEILNEIEQGGFDIVSSQPFSIEIESSPGINQSRVSPDIVFWPGSDGNGSGGYVDENGIFHIRTGSIYTATNIVNE